MVVVDKKQRGAVVIDAISPADRNIRNNKHKKIEKHQGALQQLEQMWSLKVKAIP